ncbi:MFS general substrate transporter [Periconia macrospinosa]|uniref:MFS general substrate transporter n=1 Tax=Periconia macrospinosa TaxID=97972 RepID=A0A2V1ECP0_9PLEO|nr:MFS general substrate transporter [Periconia macrospinosa]
MDEQHDRASRTTASRNQQERSCERLQGTTVRLYANLSGQYSELGNFESPTRSSSPTASSYSTPNLCPNMHTEHIELQDLGRRADRIHRRPTQPECRIQTEQGHTRGRQEAVHDQLLTQPTSSNRLNQSAGVHIGWVILSSSILYLCSQIPILTLITIETFVYQDIDIKSSHWIYLSYLLGSSAIAPLAGHIFDRFERRWVVYLAPLAIIFGLLTCAIAKALPVFTFGLILTGMGAGASEIAALAITMEAGHRDERRSTQMLFLTTLPCFFCASIPVASYYLSHSLGWRLCLSFTLALPVLATVLLIVLYKPNPRYKLRSRTTTNRGPIRTIDRFDWLGSFLSFCGMAMVMFALQWTVWERMYHLAFIIPGVALLAAHSLWQTVDRTANWMPATFMLPIEKRNGRIGSSESPRSFVTGLIIMFLGSIGSAPMIFFWPTQVHAIYKRDWTTSEIGFNMTPTVLAPLGSIGVLLLLGLCCNRIEFKQARRLAFLASVSCIIYSYVRWIAINPTASPQDIAWHFGLVGSIGFRALDTIIMWISLHVSKPKVLATMTGFTIAVRGLGLSSGDTVCEIPDSIATVEIDLYVSEPHLEALHPTLHRRSFFETFYKGAKIDEPALVLTGYRRIYITGAVFSGVLCLLIVVVFPFMKCFQDFPECIKFHGYNETRTYFGHIANGEDEGEASNAREQTRQAGQHNARCTINDNLELRVPPPIGEEVNLGNGSRLDFEEREGEDAGIQASNEGQWNQVEPRSGRHYANAREGGQRDTERRQSQVGLGQEAPSPTRANRRDTWFEWTMRLGYNSLWGLW